MSKKSAIGLWLVAGLAAIFGVLTIASGGHVLFGGPLAQAAAGQVVPFVLWFNFLSGFVYLLAGICIALRKPWASGLATGLALALLVVFALFGWHVLHGGAYEMRTVGAMTLRTAVWIGIAVYLRHSSKSGPPHQNTS